MTSVLMIDDDVELCLALQEFLITHEIGLIARHDAASGLEALRHATFDVVLLDVMLPDADGLDLISEIHRSHRVPVLILSAEGTDSCRIAGLDLGADDFLSKPFNPRELVSRIHAVLRRSDLRWQRDRSPSIATTRGDSLSFDVSTKQAYFRGQRLPLTGVEFDILSMLADAPDTILDREALVSKVFQRPFHPLDRTLDVHICRLRRKLSSVQGFEDPIKTIRSSGYVFSLKAGKPVGLA